MKRDRRAARHTTALDPRTLMLLPSSLFLSCRVRFRSCLEKEKERGRRGRGKEQYASTPERYNTPIIIRESFAQESFETSLDSSPFSADLRSSHCSQPQLILTLPIFRFPIPSQIGMNPVAFCTTAFLLSSLFLTPYLPHMLIVSRERAFQHCSPVIIDLFAIDGISDLFLAFRRSDSSSESSRLRDKSQRMRQTPLILAAIAAIALLPSLTGNILFIFNLLYYYFTIHYTLTVTYSETRLCYNRSISKANPP